MTTSDKSEDLMMTVLSEIRGIKDTVDTMNVKMENMQSKVDSMQGSCSCSGSGCSTSCWTGTAVTGQEHLPC